MAVRIRRHRPPGRKWAWSQGRPKPRDRGASTGLRPVCTSTTQSHPQAEVGHLGWSWWAWAVFRASWEPLLVQTCFGGPILWDSSSPSVVPGPAASASPGNCRDEYSQPTWASEQKLPGESPQSRAPPPPPGSWCSPGENLQFDGGPGGGWHWLGGRPGPGPGREAGGNRTG